MRHIRLFSLTLMAVALASACGGRPMPGGGGGGTSAAGGGSGNTGGGTASMGGGTGNTGGGTGTGGGMNTCPTVTVTEAMTSTFLYEKGCISVTNAVVVGASTPFMSTGASCVGNKMQQTFYIQDNGAAAGDPGVAVFKGCKDDVPTVAVGDIVSVSGNFAQFDSSYQISTYKTVTLLQLAKTGTGGMSSSGAYAPAGMPVAIAGTDMTYAHGASSGDPHHDQLGVALHFSNVTVTNRYPIGFRTTKADGGSNPAGFELSNGVWVDDSIVFHDCSGSIPGDGGVLPNGISGFWDRYSDFYGAAMLPDGGYQNNTVPVLVPLTCADLQ